MARHEQKTKVFIDGKDISALVFGATLRRNPNAINTVELDIAVDSLDVRPDGTLIIHIDTNPEA